jgi:hypothetical protein
MSTEAILERTRRFMLLLSGLVFVSALIELVLVQHTNEALQLVPFGLCVIGLGTLGAVLLRPRRSTLLLLRAGMALVAVGGTVGVTVHLLRNMAFEQDIRPNVSLGGVFISALSGAAPLLAPGVFVFGALLGLVATYYHPLLRDHTSV